MAYPFQSARRLASSDAAVETARVPSDVEDHRPLSTWVVRPNSDQDSASDAELGLTPSLEACAELQYAYAYFNDALWDGLVPPCMIVYTRKKHCLGYFSPDRFRRLDGIEVPELALHSGHLALRSDRDSLSTLVHEMAHVWRHYLGPLNRNGKRVTNGYHDRHWANEMLRVGLVPSNTGAPGGRRTGYRMSHYIAAGGPFDRACAALLETGFRINWADRVVRANPVEAAPEDKADTPKKKDRVKFSCPICDLNAWAKPSAKLVCGTCSVEMTSPDNPDAEMSRSVTVPAVSRRSP